MEQATDISTLEQAKEHAEAIRQGESDEAMQTRPNLFAFSAYVDLPGACEAEESKRGSCKDSDHFHAWCRLPNKFQHRDIREKAMAAKARRQRQLRDPDADANAVLEAEMDTLLRADKDTLIEEIIGRDAWKVQLEAVKDVNETEAEVQPEDAIEPVLKYAHIEDDEKRLRELEALPDEDRPSDEFMELGKHVTGYYEAIEQRMDEIQEPQRNTLREREVSDLVDIIREDRIESESTDEYLHTYNAWEWVVGTLHADKSGRKFHDLSSLKENAPEEAVDAIQLTFSTLEREAQEGKG